MSTTPAPEEVQGETGSIHSKELVKQLADAFGRLDVNKDGKVDRQEFISGILKDKDIQKILHLKIEDDPASNTEESLGQKTGSLRNHRQYISRRGKNLGVVLEYFKRLDKDNSGDVCADEFSAFFQSELLTKMIEKQLEAKLSDCKNLSGGDVAMLKQLFAFMDTDSSGLVSYTELCEHVGHKMAKEMMVEMDTDHNAYLGLDEFLQSLDKQHEKTEETVKTKALGTLAKSCLTHSRQKRKAFTQASFPSLMVVEKKIGKKKMLTETKEQPTDLIKAYVAKMEPSKKSILSEISGAGLAPLTEE